jgi:hypothetical protein
MTATLTLYDYRKLEKQIQFLPYLKLTRNNGRRACFDGRTMWMSRHVLSLWHDRRDREAWERFARAVEVVNIDAIGNQWEQGL